MSVIKDPEILIMGVLLLAVGFGLYNLPFEAPVPAADEPAEVEGTLNQMDDEEWEELRADINEHEDASIETREEYMELYEETYDQRASLYKSIISWLGVFTALYGLFAVLCGFAPAPEGRGRVRQTRLDEYTESNAVATDRSCTSDSVAIVNSGYDGEVHGTWNGGDAGDGE